VTRRPAMMEAPNTQGEHSAHPTDSLATDGVVWDVWRSDRLEIWLGTGA
jgi:hypothetical protein